MDRVAKLASQKAVVIFSKSSCCMSHTIKRLFYELGVSPAIHELDEDSMGREMEWAIMRLGCSPSVPAVFIGGRLVGSTNEVMTLHLNASLIPMLKDADDLGVCFNKNNQVDVPYDDDNPDQEVLDPCEVVDD